MAGTPFRIRMTSSASSAQLRGVSGTRTDGITLDGTYNSQLDMHEFNVQVTGRYKLYEDTAGGANYSERTDWGGSDGKVLYGDDVIDHVAQGVIVGGDKYSSIQDGIDAAGDYGGVVQLMPGTYALPQTTIDLKSGIVLQGSGMGATKLDASKNVSDVCPVLKALDVDEVIIRDLEIDGNTGLTFGSEFDHLIHLENCNRVVIENCYLHDAGGDGIYVRGVNDLIIRNCIIEIPHISGSPWIGRNGVAIVDGQRITIQGCTFHRCSPAAIDLEPNASQSVYDVTITGNVIKNSDGHSVIFDATNGPVEDVTLVGNVIKENDHDSHVWVGAAANINISGNVIGGGSGSGTAVIDVIGAARNAFIEGNFIFDGPNEGIETHSGVQDVFIVGNRIQGCGGAGILVNGSASQGNERVFIMNNYVKDCSQNGDGNSDGIAVWYTDRGQVVGNIVLSTTTPRHRYGIYLANCDFFTLVGNNITANATANIVTSGCTALVEAANHESSDPTNSHMSGFRPIPGNDMIIKLGSGESFVVKSSGGDVIAKITEGGNADFNQSGIGVVVVPVKTSAPAGVEGALYYNSAEKRLYVHNGTGWDEIAFTDDIGS